MCNSERNVIWVTPKDHDAGASAKLRRWILHVFHWSNRRTILKSKPNPKRRNVNLMLLLYFIQSPELGFIWILDNSDTVWESYSLQCIIASTAAAEHLLVYPDPENGVPVYLWRRGSKSCSTVWRVLEKNPRNYPVLMHHAYSTLASNLHSHSPTTDARLPTNYRCSITDQLLTEFSWSQYTPPPTNWTKCS